MKGTVKLAWYKCGNPRVLRIVYLVLVLLALVLGSGAPDDFGWIGGAGGG